MPDEDYKKFTGKTMMQFVSEVSKLPDIHDSPNRNKRTALAVIKVKLRTY